MNMKHILILAMLSFVHLTVPAQKQFQGKIVYQAKSGANEKDTAMLVLLFGKNAFQLQFKERSRNDDYVTIVRLDSGKVYNLNKKSKSYSEKKLAQSFDFPSPTNKAFAGYTTTFSEIITRRIETAFSYSGKKTQMVQFFADSLFFTVPSIYKDNEELAFFKDGKIMLGATIKVFGKQHTWETENVNADNIMFEEMSLEAIEVVPMQINDSDFLIPAGYTLKNPDDDVAMDTVRRVDDSVMKAETEIKKSQTAPKTKKPVKKTNTPTKKTTKSPARKPE
jgi:hypothetical protein